MEQTSIREVMKKFSETAILSSGGPMTIYYNKNFPAKDLLLRGGKGIIPTIGEYINTIGSIPFLQSEIVKVEQCWIFLLSEIITKEKISKPHLENFNAWIQWAMDYEPLSEQ